MVDLTDNKWCEFGYFLCLYLCFDDLIDRFIEIIEDCRFIRALLTVYDDEALSLELGG